MFARIFRLPALAHSGAAIASFAAFQGIKSALDASYAASGYPVDYATGQLSFSAEKLEGYYAAMQAQGTLPIYVRTQVIDFGFLAMVGITALMLGTLAARLSMRGQWGHRLGMATAILGIGGAGMDAAENLMSFVLLANPADISTPLALIYSAFAAVKFALLVAAVFALIGAVAFGLFGHLRAMWRKITA